MARFDVYKTEAGDFLLECQADMLSHLNTRFVVPLLPPETAQQASLLNPVFEIDGQLLVMYTQFAASVRSNEMRKLVGSLVDKEFEIGRALDMLINGH
jgi:toxin CcdB